MSDGFLRRVCAAYKRASVPSEADIWSDLQGYSRGLREALAADDIGALRAQLSDLFGVESALTGMAHSERFFRAKGSYPANFLAVRCRDALLSLAEAIGARPVSSNLQTSWRDYLRLNREPLDTLLADVELKLGHSLAPPALGGPPVIACGKRTLNPDSLRHGYVAHRIEQLGVAKNSAILEIGGGFGTVARYALMRGFTDYTIIDLPFVCAIQAAFVADSFGEDSVELFGETNAARVKLLPSSAKGDLRDDYTLVLNVDSLPEIAEAADYIALIARVTPWFLSINQEASNARTGFKQNVVARMCDGDAAFSRRSRHIYWMEQGYVEELYSVRRSGVGPPTG